MLALLGDRAWISGLSILFLLFYLFITIRPKALQKDRKGRKTGKERDLLWTVTSEGRESFKKVITISQLRTWREIRSC